jgi:hypothetical protein
MKPIKWIVIATVAARGVDQYFDRARSDFRN